MPKRLLVLMIFYHLAFSGDALPKCPEFGHGLSRELLKIKEMVQKEFKTFLIFYRHEINYLNGNGEWDQLTPCGQLRARCLAKLFKELKIPLVSVFVTNKNRGLQTGRPFLSKLSESFTTKIDKYKKIDWNDLFKKIQKKEALSREQPFRENSKNYKGKVFLIITHSFNFPGQTQTLTKTPVHPYDFYDFNTLHIFSKGFNKNNETKRNWSMEKITVFPFKNLKACLKNQNINIFRDPFGRVYRKK